MKKYLLGLLFSLFATAASAQALPVCNWGDMIYRGSTGYQCVPYDNTPGKFLQGQGASAAPIWTFQAPQNFVLPTQSTNTALMNVTGHTASPTPGTASQFLDTIGYDTSRPPAPGSILYKSAVGGQTWQALLAAPSTGYVLASGGSANPPYWAPSTTSAGLDAICTTQGAVLYRSAVGWVCLNPGTAGYTLITQGPGANPAWGPVTVAGAALTKNDDTNVTLTLGGSPTTALVNAASITAGWTGTLSVSRGGTGLGSGTSGGIPYFNSGTTLASSGVLAANALMIGGGAGAAPATTTTGTGVLTALGNTAGGAGGFALVGSTPPTGAAGGDLTGTYPNPTLAAIGSATGPLGSATVAPIVTIDTKGRVTALTSATITPAVGDITGLGTGVATALGVNVGSAGAFVTFNGALGTPSSATLTSATGLPISTGVSGLGTGVATMLGTAIGSAGGPVKLLGSTTIALGTSAISANTCGTAATGTITGIATTDIIDIGFQGDPTATTGYTPSASVSLVAYRSAANTVAIKQCNYTGSSITPSALTVNVAVRQ